MGSQAKQKFGDHLDELRKRIIVSLLFIIAGAFAGYLIHGSILTFLQKPLNQQLYYSSPIGGFNAVMKISILFGLVIGIPFLLYQLIKFIEPAFNKSGTIKPLLLMSVSFLLATAGTAFGYYVSLPAALDFLTHIDGQNLKPLIGVGEYLNFVFGFLVSFAGLFQLPLIILLINRLSPIKPRLLIKYQRWVILLSFVLAAILTPTPDPYNQLLMALPIILLFEISVFLVWIINKRKASTSVKIST